MQTDLVIEALRCMDESRLAIFAYIEVFYNRERLHSSPALPNLTRF